MTEKSQPSLTHLDSQGQAQIVDITDREMTPRTARVLGRVLISETVVDLIQKNGISKGNVLEIARIAGIMGAKKTSELIPLCHPIAITGVDIQLVLADGAIEITATVKTTDRTGVEMEAFTSVSVAALTIIDMIKAVDPTASIASIALQEKDGGKNGRWVRP